MDTSGSSGSLPYCRLSRVSQRCRPGQELFTLATYTYSLIPSYQVFTKIGIKRGNSYWKRKRSPHVRFLRFSVLHDEMNYNFRWAWILHNSLALVLYSCCVGWMTVTYHVSHQCLWLYQRTTHTHLHVVTWHPMSTTPHSSSVLYRRHWHHAYASCQVVSQYHSCLTPGKWVSAKPLLLHKLQCLPPQFSWGFDFVLLLY